MSEAEDVGVERHGHVSVVELLRPPHNFFDVALLTRLADCLEHLADDGGCRAVVLASHGKSFCAGAELGGKSTGGESMASQVYDQARRLFRFPKPIVAAVQGAAIGGGLGLAMASDFRVACPEARFSANFTALGFHPGFGLTATLPRAIGQQQAALLFLTSRRIGGEEAARIGLADTLVPKNELRGAALDLAGEIAAMAPLAVVSTRTTLRLGLYEAVDAALRRELEEQVQLRKTDDFAEGVAAMRERRTPTFRGQ